MKTRKISVRQQIKNLGLLVTSFTPADQSVDAEWVLGGAYDGLEISVGRGYYSITRKLANGKMLFVDGNGNLAAELNTAAAY